MPTLLFVYGTLKQGFPNHHLNQGRRIPGTFRTRQPFPLYVVRLPHENRAPWLVHQPGEGHPVTGEVFEIDEALLPAMDAFEEVGLPHGYLRVEIELDASPGDAEDTAPLRAQAYMKAADQLPECLEREGPFPEYTLALAAGYYLDNPANLATTGLAAPSP
jgi:gamma-glutamylaminecyclotransferase